MNIDENYRFGYLATLPGVVYHDLSGELNRRGKQTNIRFTYDRHYNPETHGFIGERLTEILTPEVERLRRAGGS